MFNPLISPEIALMLKKQCASNEDVEAALELGMDCNEFEFNRLSTYERESCNAMTIAERELELDTEEERKHEALVQKYLDKYQPNDGTSAFERKLRRQGLRKKDDEEWQAKQDLLVEVYDLALRRAKRIHILRTKQNDAYLN